MGIEFDQATGYVAETAEEIYAELAAGTVASTERTDLDTSTDSPLGRLWWPMVVQFTTLQWAIAQFPWLFDPETVSGIGLDIVNSLRGTSRLPATNSRVTLRITGTPTADIGGVLLTTGENDQWMVVPPAIIGAGGLVEVDAEATEAGAVVPGPTWATVAEQPEIFTITQLGDPQPGRDLETPEANRARLRGVAEASPGTQPGGYDAILGVPGIDPGTLWIHYNPTDMVDPRTGNVKRSVEVVVAGGTLPALGNAIRAGVSDVATVVGDLPISVVVPETGQTLTYYVTRPSPLRGFASVTLDTAGAINALPTDVVATVRAAVQQWAETLVTNQLGESSAAVAAVRAALPAGVAPSIVVGLGTSPGPAAQFLDPGPRRFIRVSGGPTAPTIVGNLAPPFSVPAASILEIDTSEGTDFVVFPDAIPAATTEQIVEHYNGIATFAVASADPNGQLRLTSKATGATRTLELGAGSTPGLVIALGLPAGLVSGSDSDVDVTVI